MKFKRGVFLGEKFIRIFLAVLVLLILTGPIYAGVTNYFKNSETEKAKRIVGLIEGKIEAIEDRGKFSFVGIGEPKEIDNNWYLVGWGRDDKGKPDRCIGGSCVCVCKDDAVKYVFFDDRVVEYDLQGRRVLKGESLGKVCSDVQKGFCTGVKSSVAGFDDVNVFTYVAVPGKISALEDFIFGDRETGAFTLFRPNPEMVRGKVTYVELPSKLVEINLVKSEDGKILYLTHTTEEARQANGKSNE